MSLYLNNLRGKNWDLVIACCVATLRIDRMRRDGSLPPWIAGFTWKDVPCHQMRLVSLMNRGIIYRVPGTRDLYEYVAPAATLEWYHKHIDGSD